MFYIMWWPVNGLRDLLTSCSDLVNLPLSVVTIWLTINLWLCAHAILSSHIFQMLFSQLCIIFPIQLTYNPASLAAKISKLPAFVTFPTITYLLLMLLIAMYAVESMHQYQCSNHLCWNFLAKTLHWMHLIFFCKFFTLIIFDVYSSFNFPLFDLHISQCCYYDFCHGRFIKCFTCKTISTRRSFQLLTISNNFDFMVSLVIFMSECSIVIMIG